MHDLEVISLPHPMEEFSAIIDVRTPAEFAEDHLPGAINLPVLTNEQRKEVGTLYKQDQFAARALGAQYISANIAKHLETLRLDWPRKHAPLLYCWRGGLRSRSFAFILRSIGWRSRIIDGGYKAYRKHVIAELERLVTGCGLSFHVLGGLTGCGKTTLLHELAAQGAQVLDLEGLANHRGSLLGNLGPQPSQKLFESRLHEALKRFRSDSPIYVEAESNRIGNVAIPPALWLAMGDAPVTEVTLPLPARARLLLREYPHFCDQPDRLASLLDELRRLRGHEMVNGWQSQIAAGDWHEFVISILRDHYDLAYRRAGTEKSNYQIPRSELAIADESPESFARAARALQNQ